MFRRLLRGERDELPGFAPSQLKIEDSDVIATRGKTHHPIVKWKKRRHSRDEDSLRDQRRLTWRKRNRYEVSGYHRVAVVSASGKHVWVYLDARSASPGSLKRTSRAEVVEELGASVGNPAELAPVGGLLVEDHRLGLEEGVKPFDPAFAADARLLESAERDAEVGAERVVSYSTRPELARR